MTRTSINRLPAWLIFCILFYSLGFARSYGQDTIYDQGSFDPDLYNGKVYNFSAYQILGHQYLQEPDFQIGTLSIDATTFDSLLLNLDIYNQQILFKNGFSNNGNVISIPRETIDRFSLGNRDFLVRKSVLGEAKIFEFIGNRELRFLRAWRKDIKVISGSGAYQHEFAREVMTLYLEKEGLVSRVKNRRDLINCFSESIQPEVKKYLRENRIRLKRVDNEGLENLAIFLKSITT